MARRPQGEIERRRHCVYRHYDAQGVLLYVGCCENLAKRTYAHGASQWVKHAVRSDGTWYDNLTLARAAEAEAIRSEGPVFNVHGQGVGPGGYDVERRRIMARYLSVRERGEVRAEGREAWGPNDAA